MNPLRHFQEIWAVDFEYQCPYGERPVPHCVVARELRSNRSIRLWLPGNTPASPPYRIDSQVLFIAFTASAELLCHLRLGWAMPERVLDLAAEFRLERSGLETPYGHSLLGALTHYGLSGIDAAEKTYWRDLCTRGGPFTEEERRGIIDYCETDVVALQELLPIMLPRLDLPRALLRGRYMAAAAAIEWNGVPIDREMFERLQANWDSLKHHAVYEINKDFNVYTFDEKGVPSFCERHFEAYLSRRNIPWPHLASGRLALDDDKAFDVMAKVYPSEIGPIREMRNSLSKLKLNELSVGRDSRNRCMLGTFGSKTGRNQPSNSRFIFGPSTWIRSLIKPAKGRAIAYLDWSQQELGIAAKLSGDPAMQAAYESGDFYIWLGIASGALPPGATEESHPSEREQFKTVSLGVMFGQTEWGISRKLNISPCHARDLLSLHQRTFPTFWKWSKQVEMQAALTGYLEARLGWRVYHQTGKLDARSMRNFPMQGNGSEMMRVACCLATEDGIMVNAPVHDALLVEGDIDEIEDVVARTQGHMRQASRIVLDGFELRSKAKVVKWPDRYVDGRGKQMWDTVSRLLERSELSVPKLSMACTQSE